VAADACKKLYAGKDKSFIRKILALGAVLHLVGNAAFSVFMLVVSSQNYPGKYSIHPKAGLSGFQMVKTKWPP
jgi:hypothetical protein